MAIISAARSAANRQAKMSEIDDVKQIALLIAKYKVEKRLQTPNAPVDKTSEKYFSEVDVEHTKTLFVAQMHPEHFSKLMEEYINDTQFDKIQDAAEKKFLMRMDLVKKKAGGGHEFREGSVIATVAKKAARVAGHSTTGDLGMKRPPRTGIFAGFSEYDPNERGTPEVDRLEAIDKKMFKTDSEYRSDRIAEAKRYDKMGMSASNAQRKMADWVREKEEDDKYRRQPQERMSASEKAMYSIGRGAFGLVGSAFGTSKKFAGAIGSKLMTAPVTPASGTVQQQLDTQVSPLAVSPSIQPKGHQSPSGRGSKDYVAANDDGNSPSYIMSNADVESKDEEKDEQEEKTYEHQDKVVTLLEKIDDDIKKIEGGEGMLSSLKGLLPGLLTGLSSGFSGLISGMGARLAQAVAAALPLMGPAIALSLAGFVGWKIGEKLSDEMSDDVKDAVGRGVNSALNVVGLGVDDSAHIAARNNINKAKNVGIVLADNNTGGEFDTGEYVNYEPTKQTRADAIAIVKKEADIAVADKTNKGIAGAVANISNNQNTNVSPTAPVISRNDPTPSYRFGSSNMYLQDLDPYHGIIRQ